MYLAPTSITPRNEFGTFIVFTVTIIFLMFTGDDGVANLFVDHEDPLQYKLNTPLSGTTAFVDIVDSVPA